MPNCKSCLPGRLKCDPDKIISEIAQNEVMPEVEDEIFLLQEQEGRSMRQLKKLGYWPVYKIGRQIIRGPSAEEIESIAQGPYRLSGTKAHCPIRVTLDFEDEQAR